MGRNFSHKQKQATALIQDASIDLSEADHIDPFSNGGVTNVENCQLISNTANRTKAAFVFKPRVWQTEFLDRWENREPHQPFMLIAIPGGGKTMAALEACRRWMAAGSDRRVIFVVPSDNLRIQWKDEAEMFGLSLQTKEFGTNFKHGFQGGVVTYHLVANQPLVFRKLCSVSPTMVVFDEVHHCGDEAHFGIGIVNAFELAKERLLMSGTPWKSDGRPIPFVKYDGGGFAVGDYSYDYPRALQEDVVRYLVFDHAKGSIRNDCTNEVETLSQEVSDNEAAQRLRRLLDPLGDYVREQIQAAHRKLLECRKTVSDAGALAACVDQSQAVKIAAIIQEITGCEPSVIVSDGELENDSVKEFRKSRKEWLVAVRKVSEGTDIKRLQVLCYLTNTTSELFFRQLIGRVSRVRGMEDDEAYIFLPADPRLIRCAQNIENAQVQALIDITNKEARELSERQQGMLDFDSYSTQHGGTEVVVIGSERVSLRDARDIERIAETVGVSMQKVRQILAMKGDVRVATQSEPVHASPPMEDRMDVLRKKCTKTANRLARMRNIHIAEIHGRFKAQSEMSEKELQVKLDSLVSECKKAAR